MPALPGGRWFSGLALGMVLLLPRPAQPDERQALSTVGVGDRAAQPLLSPAVRTVCLNVSPALTISARQEADALGEVQAIWRPHRVVIRQTRQDEQTCDWIIVVKSDAEAVPDELSHDAALAWVPFVQSRARRLVFVRVSRARMMINRLSPGTRPAGLTDLLVAKLLGRSLAHEIGHVLLNTREHAATGLMRGRVRADDVLRDPPSSYTLAPQQRARLFAHADEEARRAKR